jgi:hypothetical protein
MNEKRQFFRIQQDVIFDFKCVNTDTIAHTRAEQHFDHASTLGIFAQFQQLDNDSRMVFEQIQQENQTLASYLQMLNQKMNLLSQQMLANDAVSAHDSESGLIDLSQGGMGFYTTEPIGIENWLAIKLVFLPDYAGFLSYAQVTRNQRQTNGSYLIGVRFHQLNEEQERILARQVLKSQLIQKREHKSQVHH